MSGFSTSAAGFMMSNKALVVAGAFVGCSGIILTLVMCRAMNRSVSNVLLGGFGDGATPAPAKVDGEEGEEQGTVTEVSAEDVVEMLTSAKAVIVVPGYGMAVAKAQHSIQELTTRLRARGIKVRFAIHPVAGRMPGHMNVLLAEANVPYDITLSMDDINADFKETDVVLILGGNGTFAKQHDLEVRRACFSPLSSLHYRHRQPWRRKRSPQPHCRHASFEGVGSE
jgi:H+-translocating NAD(P) transhydrogenase subunit beta